MNENTQIEKSYINLSYNFIYDQAAVKESEEIVDSDLKYANLLNYADRLFKKNRIKYFKDLKGKNLYLSGGAKDIKKGIEPYKLKLDKAYIVFFEDEMAFLNIRVNIANQSLSDLYKINKLLTNFYKKGNESYILVGDDNALRKELDYYFYTPHKKENRDYPFNCDAENEEIKQFGGRVGPYTSKKEKICELECIKEQNGTEVENIKRHYLYFENQQKMVVKNRRDDICHDFIHFDTFVTSLILEYVKPNDGLIFFDNFNPIATNYINSYITLVCDDASESNILENEHKSNFLSLEPLLNAKVKRGEKIIQPDFFEVYQSQADMFTIGNSHSIVHILDKNSKHMANIKYDDHFYTYQLTQLQRNSVLKIINSSILNINEIDESQFFLFSWKKISKIYRSYKVIANAADNYTKFLTNTNFVIISSSSSVDNSYNFFRKCNEVDKLIDQWNRVSFKLSDPKSILSHILGPVFTIAIAGLIVYNFLPTIMSLF